MMALTDQSPDGLGSIRTITAGALAHLRPNGWLVLEHGYNQAEAVRQLMGEARLTAVQSTRDLAGIERVTSGQRPA
jgi:release factor glutamine methyltransferase